MAGCRALRRRTRRRLPAGQGLPGGGVRLGRGPSVRLAAQAGRVRQPGDVGDPLHPVFAGNPFPGPARRPSPRGPDQSLADSGVRLPDVVVLRPQRRGRAGGGGPPLPGHRPAVPARPRSRRGGFRRSPAVVAAQPFERPRRLLCDPVPAGEPLPPRPRVPRRRRLPRTLRRKPRGLPRPHHAEDPVALFLREPSPSSTR